MAFESEDIPIAGHKEMRVHNGMLLTAQNIRRKLLGQNEAGVQTEDGLLARAWRQLENDVGVETAKVPGQACSHANRSHTFPFARKGKDKI